MPLTIITKFYPPTATRGARFVAKTPDPKLPSRSVGAGGIPALENREAEHRYAATLFQDQLGWKGTLIGGEIAPGEWAWIQLPSQYEAAVEAVVETRLAIRRGDNHGNPHLHPYGRKVTGLTDDGGAFEYHYQKRLVAEFGGTFNAAKAGGGEA